MALTRNYSQRNSSWNAPYTFSGKEKDTETGYGYFGARYYDSGLSIWLSVDPMSDKYPSMSPYNYCANNPVRFIDPKGEDIYEFDMYEKLIGQTSAGYDQIVIKDGEKTISTSQQYTMGMIKMQTPINSPITIFEITDQSRSTEIFEFMGTKGNTKVEWENLLFDNGKSYLGSSQEKAGCGIGGKIIDSENKKGAKLLQHSHNHPSTNLTPSGLLPDKGRKAGEYGDIGFRKGILAKNPDVKTYIFNGIPGSLPNYQEYNNNGKVGGLIKKPKL